MPVAIFHKMGYTADAVTRSYTFDKGATVGIDNQGNIHVYGADGKQIGGVSSWDYYELVPDDAEKCDGVTVEEEVA